MKLAPESRMASNISQDVGHCRTPRPPPCPHPFRFLGPHHPPRSSRAARTAALHRCLGRRSLLLWLDSDMLTTEHEQNGLRDSDGQRYLWTAEHLRRFHICRLRAPQAQSTNKLTSLKEPQTGHVDMYKSERVYHPPPQITN